MVLNSKWENGVYGLLLMIEILHYLKGPKRWELWRYMIIPYYG